MTLKDDFELLGLQRRHEIVMHWSKLDHVLFLGVGAFLALSYWFGVRMLLVAGILWLGALFADMSEVKQ